MIMRTLSVLCLALLPVVQGRESDRVTVLPGWPHELPSKQYSGFINVTGKEGVSPAKEMMVHYYYIESEGNAVTDPLILWSNGGPGASSMFGFMTEMGPFMVNDNSLKTVEYNQTGIPSLFYNEYGWTHVGGLLMFDWPPPTGFSYCDGDPTGDGYSCGNWTDTRMGQVSFAALEGFFEIFPELKVSHGGLFLTGESYAGVYIPKLAQQIIAHNKVEEFNLEGIAVGDACAGTEVLCGGDSGFGPWWDYLFLYGHGQISNKLYDDLMSFCGIDNLKYNYNPPNNKELCDDAKGRVSVEAGGYYTYNLYDDCIYENYFRRVLLASSESVNGAVNDYVCGAGPVQSLWTDEPAVRVALNVQVDANFFSGDNAVGMNYELDEKNLMPFYYKVALDTNVRTMVYNGDADPSVNSFNAQNWTSHLGLKELESWRPWTLDSCQRMGGYITTYEGDFSFVTIRGAGHMVPEYKPPHALTMITNFVQNEKFALYDASCSDPSFKS